MWNSYERRVMKAARTMSWQSRRLVRNILLAERARALIEKSQQPKRAGWLARSRAAARQLEATRKRLAGMMPTHARTMKVREQGHEPRAVTARAGTSRPSPLPSGPSRATQVETHQPASPRGGGEANERLAPQPERALIKDIMAGTRSVPERPHLSAPEQGHLLLRDPEARLQGGPLVSAKPGQELSLVERMLAGTALDAVRAIPTEMTRALEPDRNGSSDRSR